MPSKIRDIADILGVTEAANPTKAVLTSVADGSGLVVYATPNLLPTSGFTAGDQAFVTSNKKLYISTSTGWYAVATANLAPVITDNGLDTALVTGGSNVDVVLSATDAEGLPLTWTYEVTSGSIGGTTVSQVDNVFTFTPSSNVADEGTFNVTFTANDGINTSNVVKTFNLSNDPPVIGSYTSSYNFATDGTPIILTLTATDPEGQDITWSYNVTSGSLGSTATVSQANNVFTITPSTNAGHAGQFTLTFTASDGTNSDTAAIAFNLTFVATDNYKINLSTFTVGSPQTFLSDAAPSSWGISGIDTNMQYRAIDGSNDGQYIFAGGETTTGRVALARYTLGTPYDLSTSSFTHAVEFTSLTDNNVRGMHISANGSYIFFALGTGGINKLTLATPYDLSSLTTQTPQSWTIATLGGSGSYFAGCHFSENGLNFYAGASGVVCHYILSVAWDLNTASLINEESISASTVRDVWLNKPGTQLVTSTNAAIRSYDLTTPFNLSSKTNLVSKSGTFAPGGNSPTEFFFWKTGKFFHSDYSNSGAVWYNDIDTFG